MADLSPIGPPWKRAVAGPESRYFAVACFSSQGLPAHSDHAAQEHALQRPRPPLADMPSYRRRRVGTQSPSRSVTSVRPPTKCALRRPVLPQALSSCGILVPCAGRPSRKARSRHLADIFLFVEENTGARPKKLSREFPRPPGPLDCSRANLMREEGLEALLFVMDVDAGTDTRRVTIERDADLSTWRFGAVLDGHRDKPRGSGISSNGSFYVASIFRGPGQYPTLARSPIVSVRW